jgi:HSP20 family protein
MATRREHPMARVQRDFDTLFNRLLGGGWLAPYEQDFEPLRVWDFDVTDNDKEIVVRAEMPGFAENEIEATLDNNVLTLKAEKEQKGDGREEYRNFYRTVALPPVINPDKAQATYHNGVLELHIPKAAEAQPRRISILRQQAATGQKGQPEQQQAASGEPTTTAGQTAKK